MPKEGEEPAIFQLLTGVWNELKGCGASSDSFVWQPPSAMFGFAGVSSISTSPFRALVGDGESCEASGSGLLLSSRYLHMRFCTEYRGRLRPLPLLPPSSSSSSSKSSSNRGPKEALDLFANIGDANSLWAAVRKGRSSTAGPSSKILVSISASGMGSPASGTATSIGTGWSTLMDFVSEVSPSVACDRRQST